MSNEDKIILKEIGRGICCALVLWALLIIACLATGSGDQHIDPFGSLVILGVLLVVCGFDGVAVGMRKAREHWLKRESR